MPTGELILTTQTAVVNIIENVCLLVFSCKWPFQFALEEHNLDSRSGIPIHQLLFIKTMISISVISLNLCAIVERKAILLRGHSFGSIKRPEM